jgi:hypothetical protein
MEYVEHLAWLLFLRFLDAQEEVWEAEAALAGRPYERILDGDLTDDTFPNTTSYYFWKGSYPPCGYTHISITDIAEEAGTISATLWVPAEK